MTHRLRAAFTLVELLVVIAIIAIIMSILLPGLKNAKLTAKMIKEQAQMKEAMRGYLHYASDNRDSVNVAAPHWDWCHGQNTFEIKPPDPIVKGGFLTGSCAKTWPLLLYGYLEWPFFEVQMDSATYTDFFSRPKTSALSGHYTSYGAESYQVAMQWHPTFGLNGVFIGGSYQHGAFRGSVTAAASGSQIAMPGPNTRVAGGNFYVRKVGDVRYSSNLLVFASSRGCDVRGDSGGSPWWGWGANNPDTGIVRPGHWLITAPNAGPVGMGGATTPFTVGSDRTHSGTGWLNTPVVNSDVFDDRQPPSAWGMLFPKHFKKFVTTGMMDGHAEMQTLRDLRDMRKWSNNADTANWTFQPGR